MLVKICGITTVEAADAAVRAGADLIGFVFAESKRRISPIEAEKIASALPSSIKTVGVFVNETVNNILDIADTVGLDVIQLHGDEPPEMIEQLPYEVIKAIPAKPESLNTIQNYMLADFFLIDSPYGKYRGGNGTTFDWDTLRNLPINRSKLLLAGGLHAKNVQEAVQQVSPAGVDVSSGVETDGNKDRKKIIEFVNQAKV
jgi:phosphoribosylanthranilate isomerase